MNFFDYLSKTKSSFFLLEKGVSSLGFFSIPIGKLGILESDKNDSYRVVKKSGIHLKKKDEKLFLLDEEGNVDISFSIKIKGGFPVVVKINLGFRFQYSIKRILEYLSQPEILAEKLSLAVGREKTIKEMEILSIDDKISLSSKVEDIIINFFQHLVIYRIDTLLSIPDFQ